MTPRAEKVKTMEGGVFTIVRKYEQYFPSHGITLVDEGEEYDVEIVHAGVKPFSDPGGPNVAMTHGLIWTAQPGYDPSSWGDNAQVVDSVRHAREVTCPSRWVAKTFERDMHFTPHVIPHGVDLEEWKGEDSFNSTVVWNKNRMDVVCDPRPVVELALRNQTIEFVTTFTTRLLGNISLIGVVEHWKMQRIIRRAMVYLSTTKETFGIGTLEAMAAGVPVLGFAHGGNLDIVEHGKTGYLARVGDYDDLNNGLEFCIQHRPMLSKNAIAVASQFSWDSAVEKLKAVLERAADPPVRGISVIVPCFNKEETVADAIRSALVAGEQYEQFEVIAVDDGSTDRSLARIEEVRQGDSRVLVVEQHNQGVAHARNAGIERASYPYICCLDADDQILPAFFDRTLPALESDNSLGIAYTGIRWVDAQGRTGISPWPGSFNFDEQLAKRNQIPTCCLFKREAWRRVGGYRQRYAPHGAGAEDAEMWLRMGAMGWNARKVTEEGLFMYRMHQGATSDDYVEPPWTDWHPWAHDSRHPFASVATPARQSHDVRAYDRPAVSVIIPVGPGHAGNVYNALDSLEAQTFRNWEVVVVNDTGQDLPVWLTKAYPFATFVDTTGSVGAGAARNAGVRASTAPMLYFLDADDHLAPKCLQLLMATWLTEGGAIYSDYYGVTKVKPEDRARVEEDVVFYDEKTGKLVVRGHLEDYDYDRMLREPILENTRGYYPYVWAPVNTLVERKVFDDVGGFNEDLESLEDWAFWLVVARTGLCFYHVKEPLFVYNFVDGRRRDFALNNHGELKLLPRIHRLVQKVKPMPCNCGGGNRRSPTVLDKTVVANGNGTMQVLYYPPGKGQHPLIVERHNYGYRQQGDIIEVSTYHVAVKPSVFRCPDCNNYFQTDPRAGTAWCNCQDASSVENPENYEDRTASPAVVDVPRDTSTVRPAASDDLTVVPGIGKQTQETLYRHGITTMHKLRVLRRDALVERYNVMPKNADRIIQYFSEQRR